MNIADSSKCSRTFAVLCRFGPKFKEVRWLNAPYISRRISNGIFQFTPDASREETEQIILGLKHTVEKDAKKNKM